MAVEAFLSNVQHIEAHGKIVGNIFAQDAFCKGIPGDLIFEVKLWPVQLAGRVLGLLQMMVTADRYGV